MNESERHTLENIIQRQITTIHQLQRMLRIAVHDLQWYALNYPDTVNEEDAKLMLEMKNSLDMC